MKSNLRKIEATDHEFLVELHNDPIVLFNVTNPKKITMEEHLSWFKEVSKKQSELRLIYEVGGQPAGLTKFYAIDSVNKNCVLGADLHASFRGKGLAKDMWNHMLKMCFTELNLYRVSLTTAEYNRIAQNVYEKLGFRREGVFTSSLLRNNMFHDQILMYMLETNWKEIHDENS